MYEENGKILFVKQYRYAYGECVLEIPAGKLDLGEDPERAALRELEEEAGIRANVAELLFVIYPSPGYTNERIYLYRVKGGERVPARLDEGEFLENEGVMEDLLFKDSSKNKSFVVKRERKGVKKAKLTYKVLKKGFFDEKVSSLVLVELQTGRSHQIRVQFASRKHPLLGDRKYGSSIVCPIGLYSHRIRTGGTDISDNPPAEHPWDIFE